MHLPRTFILLALLAFTSASVLPAEPVAERSLDLTSPNALAERALTVTIVVSNIQQVTNMSQNIKTTLQTVTYSMTTTQITIVSKQIAIEFTDIINSLNGFVSQMQGTSFAGAGAQLIANTLITFVQVHQDVLALVIGKQSVFAYFAVTAPIAGILRGLEAAIDGFAFAMIALIPGQTGTVDSGKMMLDQSCRQAIVTYCQICVPFLTQPPACLPGLCSLGL